MLLDVINVLTGERETKKFKYGEVCLFNKFQCIIKSFEIGNYEFVTEFGWDEEIEYDIEEVRGFFNLLNNYVLLTIAEKSSSNKEEFEKIKNELKKMNKWDFDLDEYVEF